jgi:hypothetical protein
MQACLTRALPALHTTAENVFFDHHHRFDALFGRGAGHEAARLTGLLAPMRRSG